MDQLPLLPTMGVGSYASPGWFVLFRSQMREGRIGPDDMLEALDDATRIAVLDQVEAGIDILSDGELRRQRFVYEMFDCVEGLERIAPGRKLGVPGYDMAPHFNVVGPIRSPRGFGVVEDFRALFADFHGMVTGGDETDPGDADLGKLAVFEGVREFPMRVKCATLAWHTLCAALDRSEKPASTE